MEKALQDRLRGALLGDVGAVYNRPAIDWHERKSNDEGAFPAIVLTTVSPGRSYYQDGADGLMQPRIRLELFGLTPLTVKALKSRAIAELEQSAVSGETRFGRSRLAFERDADPEDLPGGMKIFRTMLDFFVPNSPA